MSSPANSDSLAEGYDPIGFVHELLFGASIRPGVLAGRAAANGIPLDRQVRAFRARQLPGGSRPLEYALRGHAGHEWIGLSTVDGDVVGLTTGVPCLALNEGVVGLGPALPLARAHDSFAVASRVLDAAWDSGRRGTVRLEDVALAAAVVADEDIGIALEARYLAELDGAGRVGRQLEDTVLALLECDLSASAAGQLLGLHRNSVRYRLRQFERLTGTDLTHLEDAFRVWWVLTWRRRLRR